MYNHTPPIPDIFLAAAKILKAREAELPGTVVLLFQPAEEGPGGAAVMIAEGALEGLVGAAGLHVWPQTPSGTFTSRVCRTLFGVILAFAQFSVVNTSGCREL